MIKNNKIATGIFLILTLFNLIFPPTIRISSGRISDRKYFNLIFDMDNYQVDIKTLMFLVIISIIISIGIQFFSNMVYTKIISKNKSNT